MQQPMPNPEDITDLTTAMNMALVLMLRHQLYYSTPQQPQPENFIKPLAGQMFGNQNGYNAIQNVGNQVVQNAVQNPDIQNVGNQNGLIVVPRIANRMRMKLGMRIRSFCQKLHCKAKKKGCCFSSNLVADCSKGKGWDPTQKAEETFDFNGALPSETLIKIRSSMLTASLNGLFACAKHQHRVLKLTTLVSMTQMDQLSVEHNGGTVEQHHANVEETRSYFESLYNNFSIEVEKVNSVNHKMK
ncbi:hypothetical protein Tco_0111133 [Tanacetum coccineum]